MESINECKRKVSGAEKTTGSSASTADTLRRSGSGKRNGRQQVGTFISRVLSLRCMGHYF